MSLIASEYNFPRKAHRVSFPLFVELDGKSYRAKDWSLTGVGLLDLARDFAPGEQVRGRVILPMVDSVLSLDVTLAYRGSHRGGVAGFEFVDLAPRVKRILRHYIELGVEGRLDNLEDLVAVASAPAIRSPLEDALNLTELEAEGMLKNFQKKSAFALTFGALFVIGVVAVLFYNTAYRLQAVGFVAGNLERVTANQDGVLTSLEVTERSFVTPGTPLFRIDRVAPSPPAPVAAAPSPAQNTRLLASLREEMNARRTEYENARSLFAEHVITHKDLAIARNHYLQAQSAWLRELERTPETKGGDGTAARPEPLTVTAPAAGMVFEIAKRPGEFVRASEPVLLIQEDVAPYVLIRLLSDDALKLRIGMPARVYVPFEDRTLQAEVSAIGHAAVNAEVTESLEGSLKDTLVKLDFLDPKVRLPANARVRVWIRTF